MITSDAPIGVLGATGFVGSAVVSALQARNVAVLPVKSPRLLPPLSTPKREVAIETLAAELSGCRAVINAAGLAEAAGNDHRGLQGANAVLPEIVATVASGMGIRLVHVSSAAVQGSRAELDSSRDLAPFSPYSRSKADGEAAVLASQAKAVVFRPPGVHGMDRRVTRTIARLASGPASSVAGDGRRPSANALIANVGDAIAHLATTSSSPPAIVHHPFEGLTTGILLHRLGGKEPHHVPFPIARFGLLFARWIGYAFPPLMAYSRRLEMLWFGQRQAPSWLTADGWAPPHGLEEWTRMGETLREHTRQKETE